MGSVNPLLGRSVLIIEDEPLIALELHDALHAAGASILAATTITEALALIGYAQICAAIVDVDLRGHDCSSVCAALTKRSLPFMFYTGFSSAAPTFKVASRSSAQQTSAGYDAGRYDPSASSKRKSR